MPSKIAKDKFYHTRKYEDGERLELFYSIEGFYISANLYEEVLGRYIADGQQEEDIYKKILLDWGKNYKTELSKREVSEKKIKINTLQELLSMIKSLMSKEEVVETQKKMKNLKTFEKKIAVLPTVYYNIIKLFLACQKKSKLEKAKELESLEKTIANGQCEPFDRNSPR